MPVVVKKVGIVVPTLGLRHELLMLCLRSIREAGDVHVCIVVPETVDLGIFLDLGLFDQRVNDPGRGLANAINFGLRSLPPEIELINWLGDDDILRPDSVRSTSEYLRAHSEALMVFGSCDYIDEKSRTIGTNWSGKWAVPLLRFGPCLIPQPGALFRRDAFETCGGLNSDFRWAFDFEFFIRLSRLGELHYIPNTLAAFRWHQGSLSVGGRKHSVHEASTARKMHLPLLLKSVSAVWEVPVRIITAYAGFIVSYQARRVPNRRSKTQRGKSIFSGE